MYSFAQRPDTRAMDEPLYGHYLSITEAANYHPGAREILAHMETDGKKVVRNILKEKSVPVLFLKHMTHHLQNLPDALLMGGKNIILTRNPAESIQSFSKVIDNPSLQDLGYKEQWSLLQKLKDLNADYWITQRSTILKNPEKELKSICKWAGIPFYREMLQWPAGPKSYDGVWAPHWYSNVHQSTGFLPYEEKRIGLPGMLKTLEEQCSVYYNKIKNDKKGQP